MGRVSLGAVGAEQTGRLSGACVTGDDERTRVAAAAAAAAACSATGRARAAAPAHLLLELNRFDLNLTHLVPSATPADGEANGSAWGVPTAMRAETESKLSTLCRQLRRSERSIATARGLDEAIVQRARDQLNGMLRSYIAPVQSDEQQKMIAGWLLQMRSAATDRRPALRLSLANWSTPAAADGTTPSAATAVSGLELAPTPSSAGSSSVRSSADGEDGTGDGISSQY